MKLTPVDTQTCVLLGLAIIGAQLPGLLAGSNPVRSTDCFQDATKAIPDKPSGKPYWDQPPLPEVPASSSKTPAKGLSISDAEIDAAIARERQQRQARQSAVPFIAPAHADTPILQPQVKTIRSEIPAAEWAAMDADQRFAVESADATIATIEAQEGR